MCMRIDNHFSSGHPAAPAYLRQRSSLLFLPFRGSGEPCVFCLSAIPGSLAFLPFRGSWGALRFAFRDSGSLAFQQISEPASMPESSGVISESLPSAPSAQSSMPWERRPAIFRGARLTITMTFCRSSAPVCKRHGCRSRSDSLISDLHLGTEQLFRIFDDLTIYDFTDAEVHFAKSSYTICGFHRFRVRCPACLRSSFPPHLLCLRFIAVS